MVSGDGPGIEVADIHQLDTDFSVWPKRVLPWISPMDKVIGE